MKHFALTRARVAALAAMACALTTLAAPAYAAYAFTTIAQFGDAAPVGTFENFPGRPSLSGGTVAFFGIYNNSTSQGVFTGIGGNLTTIAKRGDAAPVGAFDEFGNPTISGGTVAFRGLYNGSASQGIFTASGGSLTSIVQKGDAAPVGTFDSFGAPAISGDTVVFEAGYDDFGAEASSRLQMGF